MIPHLRVYIPPPSSIWTSDHVADALSWLVLLPVALMIWSVVP
jgi:hypothetical protein